MRITLVRHGQSVQGAARQHQTPTVPLSSLGRQQAQLVAQRLAPRPDLIISSPLQRALETAQIIAQAQAMTVTTWELVREIKRPSLLEGHTHDDPERQAVWDALLSHYHDPNWHHSDEENWYDVKQRAQDFLYQITQQSVSEVIVVTHGMFIRTVIGLVQKGLDCQSQDVMATWETFAVPHTSVTEITYEDAKWHVVKLADGSHLLT